MYCRIYKTTVNNHVKISNAMYAFNYLLKHVIVWNNFCLRCILDVKLLLLLCKAFVCDFFYSFVFIVPQEYRCFGETSLSKHNTSQHGWSMQTIIRVNTLVSIDLVVQVFAFYKSPMNLRGVVTVDGTIIIIIICLVWIEFLRTLYTVCAKLFASHGTFLCV